ncbi:MULTISPECIES: hypothetical protein [Methylorubrum]|uniref:hypothetical protein n=1 Tax=Methylorubrum TaxID=2282523 RepID=UPI0020A14E1B|nr:MULTISPECIES: hypothetical protein [Methylorubrum]MCP1551664.1 hypothetical protein [Methylorubrum zatmanii]MCP1556592.1 hypothetical protein [Methylorubrum extorquens]MCP1581999.1 hypothetical protein [Methylorubrum extorquens]
MRNPLRNLVARHPDKLTIRERVAATRDRLTGKLRGNRAPEHGNAVSPELMCRIAECLSAEAALNACNDGSDWPEFPSPIIRRAGEARTAVALFPSAAPADTWAKARCLSQIYDRESMKAEVAKDAATGITLDGFAVALAEEVIDLTKNAGASALPSAQPDPIFAVIAEGERLLRVSDELFIIPDPDIDPLPEKLEALDAVFEHLDNVLFKTMPTTAAGCVALARFALHYHKTQGVHISDDETLIFSLIAQSPAL